MNTPAIFAAAIAAVTVLVLQRIDRQNAPPPTECVYMLPGTIAEFNFTGRIVIAALPMPDPQKHCEAFLSARRKD